MNNVLAWIKSSPVSVISAIAVLGCVGFLGWLLFSGMPGFTNDTLDGRAKKISEVVSFMRRQVSVPAPRPDDPPRVVPNVTVNHTVIDRLSQLYGRMGGEYEQLFKLAMDINRARHNVLVEGLFPDPSPSMRIDGRVEYQRAFFEMLRAYPADADPNEFDRPRLNAGPPLLPTAMEEELVAVEKEFLDSLVTPGAPRPTVATLTPDDRERLLEDKRSQLIVVLHANAEHIHIYADTDPRGQYFPFQIGGWVASAQPRPDQLWEGQLELWIQQDLADAIARTNQTHDPEMNVLEAPVKRLVRVDVLPGYVGLHNLGGVPGTGSAATTGRTGGRQTGRSTQGAAPYPMPAGGLTGEANQRLSDNFYAGPTGRVSNALYDVRHANLIVEVDFQRLPELLEQIAKVNFMTVLKTTIEDVDEYEALRRGFLYGEGDIVRVELLIETIWLRDWTSALMPTLVRQYVGIDPPSAGTQQMQGGYIPQDQFYEEPEW